MTDKNEKASAEGATKQEDAKAYEQLLAELEQRQAKTEADLTAALKERDAAVGEAKSLKAALDSKQSRSPEAARLKATLNQQHAALQEKDGLLLEREEALRVLRAELAELRRGDTKKEALVALEGLPKRAARLLTGTVLVDNAGARIYPRRGDVLVEHDADVATAQRIAGSRCRVYAVPVSSVDELVKGGAADRTG